MLDIFRGLKNLIKFSHIHIDSAVFRLHYSITVMILLAFSLIVTTRQYVGNPIDCIHNREIPEDVINTFCWIHSTYTIPSAHGKRVGIEVPHPGIDKTTNSEDRKYVKYYQWVCFCLFFQVSFNIRIIRGHTVSLILLSDTWCNRSMCERSLLMICFVCIQHFTVVRVFFSYTCLHLKSSLQFCNSDFCILRVIIIF